ncbi:hypothetical protein DD79_15490 [Salmonella enterica subsp. enterica serovar Typhimurium var. 5-]|nr:hypothetical protein DD79_15490 [Salmonella enterica subsp. enterica serovar Typhimurium var. 5-]
MMEIRNFVFDNEKFRSVKYPGYISLQRKVNLCQKPVVSVVFSFRLIRMGYRAAARCMDRHRRHFTLWPFCACQSGISCHSLTLFIALPPASFEMLWAPFSHSLSRSLSWNY